MSGSSTSRAIRRRVIPVWIGLMALLGLTCAAAYAPLGSWTAAVNFGVAAVQAALVAALFMRLDGATALVRLVAACGVFWTAILFGLTLIDVLSRLSNS